MLIKRNLPYLIEGYVEVSFDHELIRDIGQSYILNRHHKIIFVANLFSIYQKISFATLKYFIKLLLKSRSFRILPYKNVIVVTDLNSGGYFHWFLDVLTKINFINEKSDHILLLPLVLQKNSFIIQSLDYLKINYCFIDSGSILTNVNVVNVKYDYPSGNYDPNIAMSLRDRLHINGRLATRIVYISRAKASRRKMLEEEKFTDSLKKLGVEIVCCEDMTFDQTRIFFSEVKLLIAQHGAGLTNMLFMQPKSSIIEIRNLGDEHNNCYYSLASALGIDYQYCTTNEARDHNDNITFNEEFLLKHIKDK